MWGFEPTTRVDYWKYCSRHRSRSRYYRNTARPQATFKNEKARSTKKFWKDHSYRPSQKKKTGTCIKFEKQPIFEKEKRILSWVINDKDNEVMARMGKLLLKEEHVESFDLMNHAIIDKRVDLPLVRYMFDEDAWLCLDQVAKVKREAESKGKLKYFCHCCRRELISSHVQCDSCLQWSHLRCVGKVSSKKTWFCEDCKRQ